MLKVTKTSEVIEEVIKWLKWIKNFTLICTNNERKWQMSIG